MTSTLTSTADVAACAQNRTAIGVGVTVSVGLQQTGYVAQQLNCDYCVSSFVSGQSPWQWGKFPRFRPSLSVLVIARHPNTVFEGRRLLFVYLEALSKVGRQAIHLHGQGLACQVKRKVKISGLVRHLGQLDQTKGTKSRSGDREICIVV